MSVGAPEKEETIQVRMQVSKLLHDYLGTLKKKTVLGASENDVAKYLLTQKIEQMIRDRYHETEALPLNQD